MIRCHTSIQPKRIHIGHYLSSVRPVLSSPNKPVAISISDLTFLSKQNFDQNLPKNQGKKSNIKNTNIYQKCLETARWLAAMDESKKSIFYKQSDISSISELNWFLTCNLKKENLESLSSWNKYSELSGVEVGKLILPVLSVAEKILLHAASSNSCNFYSSSLKYDEYCLGNDLLFLTGLLQTNSGSDENSTNSKLKMEMTQKINALQNPINRMIVDDANKNNTIYIDDDVKNIEKLVRKATTDSEVGIKLDRINRPGTANLLDIYQGLGGDLSLILDSEMSKKDFKIIVSDLILSEISKIQNRHENFSLDEIEETLYEGGKFMNELLEPKIFEIRENFGLF